MSTIQIVAIPEQVATAARCDRRDAFGNTDLEPVVVDERPGFPCRVCLEDGAIGESMLLFSYSPIAHAAPYRTVGPIFVHEKPCRPFAPSERVPELLRSRRVALRGYDAEYRNMIDVDVVEGAEIEARAARMLADPRVARVDAHFARTGCFACRIERTGA